MKICHKCSKTSDDFKDKNSFYQHEKTHGDYTEVCDECQKSFKTKKDLKSHLNHVHQEKINCNHCELKFSKKSNLDRHLNKVKNDKGDEEPDVPDNSTSGSKENSVNMYSCPQCNKKFATQSPVLFPDKNITRKMHVLSFVAQKQIRTQNLVYKMLKVEQIGEYVHSKVNELSRQFACVNNTEKRDDILETFGHKMFTWIVL